MRKKTRNITHFLLNCIFKSVNNIKLKYNLFKNSPLERSTREAGEVWLWSLSVAETTTPSGFACHPFWKGEF